MKTPRHSTRHLLAALTTCAALAACGGGGGDGGGGGAPPPVGSNPPNPPPPGPAPAPAPAPAPSPAPSPTATFHIPFAPDKQWHYAMSEESRALGGVYEFTGDLVLYVENELQWQGRTAWKLTQLKERIEGPAKFAFTIEPLYLSQSSAGLDRWIGTETSGSWRRLLSYESSLFSNNTFLYAGRVESGRGSTVTAQVPISVPAGSFVTLEASVEFNDGDGGAGPSDIFERHHEFYADGVGLVRSSWDVDFDDNQGNGDYGTDGLVELLSVDGTPEILSESEPNDSFDSAAALPAARGYLRAQTSHSDPGMLSDDPNVFPNSLGASWLHDFYRFDVTTTGQHLVTLADFSNYETGAKTDLDLYLFREDAAGVRTYVASSTRDPATHPGGESIDMTLTPGRYYVVVQAWNTPNGAARYWLSVR